VKRVNFPSTARGVALEVLCRVEAEASYAAQSLDAHIKTLSREDGALATRLAYGTLQKRIFLDYQLLQLGGKPLSSMDIPVANALRLGAYQLFFCDKIPPSAAVNEAVNCVKACGFTSAAGLVNAVLRKAASASPVFPENEAEALAVKHSLPAWMVYHLRKSYRDEPLLPLLAALDEPPCFYLRVNTLLISPEDLCERLNREGIPASVVKDSRVSALKCDRLPSLKENPSFAEGLFHVQDLSSQLAAAAVNAQRGDRVLDVCAAPGGKTFTLAQTVHNEGEVLSCDIHPARVNLIADGAKRLHLSNVTPTVADAGVFMPSLGEFDRVLCDAPCSGLGVVRRKPEIRFKPEEELKKYPPLQYGILATACRYVKPGGRLVYATCTLNPHENEENAARFLHEHPDFTASPLFSSSEETARTFFPHRDFTDGFFVAAFERRKP